MPVKTSRKNANVKEQMMQLSASFKALSNETRLAVFENIRLGQCRAMPDEDNRPSVCSIASNFNTSLSTISHHLKELRNAGLIDCEKKAKLFFDNPIMKPSG